MNGLGLHNIHYPAHSRLALRQLVWMVGLAGQGARCRSSVADSPVAVLPQCLFHLSRHSIQLVRQGGESAQRVWAHGTQSQPFTSRRHFNSIGGR